MHTKHITPDNKVKCLERQIELKIVSKIKNIHDGKGAEISVTIYNKLVLPCNTDLSACNFTNSSAIFSLLLLEFNAQIRWLNN